VQDTSSSSKVQEEEEEGEGEEGEEEGEGEEGEGQGEEEEGEGEGEGGEEEEPAKVELPVLCQEDGKTVLRFSELFGVGEPYWVIGQRKGRQKRGSTRGQS
jgi:hypothetical protein